MKSIKLPKSIPSNELDRIGSAIFESIYANCLILIPHSGNKDFGIDYTAELLNESNGEVLGHYVAIQLKSHKRLTFNRKGYYSQRIKTTTANYWLSLNLPVVIVLLDIDNNKQYYVDVKRYLRANYDYKKYQQQKYITIKIRKKDTFSFNSCLLVSIEYINYNILYYSSSDYFIIRYFLIQMNDSTIRDWFLPVEPYEDVTNDVINLAEKYNNIFIFDYDLKKDYQKMMDIVKDCYHSNSGIDYDEYNEQTKKEFNKVAIEYYVRLIYLINNEIINDKTNTLKIRLNRFIELQSEIEKNGIPA